MRKLSFVLGSLIGLLSISAVAQNPNDKLIKINDSIYKVRDFERLYTKNLDLITDVNQKDISNYLDLFILYKLKVQKAYELGLDKTESFKEELNLHRNQLAEKYFINEEKLNALVEQAIQRDKEEINASHILVKVSKSATKEEDKKAYEKAMAIREQLLKGADFEALAQEVSDDLSAKENKGNLGYFSAFKMVHEFETGAYQTPKGEISLPVRSDFGYHIIKVIERRVKPQVREVSHIFIQKNDDLSPTELAKKAYHVHSLLNLGEDFGELAIEHSDDVSSKMSRGVMGKFNEHNLDIPNVGELVYKLKENEFTEPILSNYGYHIFQVNKIHPYPEDKEVFAGFLRKVKSDKRSAILETDLKEYLIKEYKVQFNESAINKAKTYIKADIFETENEINLKDIKKNEVLFSFDKQAIKTTEYIEWFNKNLGLFATFESIEAIRNDSFNDFVKKVLRDYYDKNLNTKYPEFNQIVNEYKEGLLLFALLEDVIWKEAKENEEVLQKIFEKDKEKYRMPQSFTGDFYSFSYKKDALNWQKALEKNADAKIEDLQVKFYKKYSGEFTNSNNRLPKGLKLEDIKNGIIEKNQMFFVFVKPEIKPSYIPTFEDAKKKVISNYLEIHEKNYFSELEKASKVTIEKEVLSKLVAKYKQ